MPIPIVALALILTPRGITNKEATVIDNTAKEEATIPTTTSPTEMGPSGGTESDKPRKDSTTPSGSIEPMLKEGVKFDKKTLGDDLEKQKRPLRDNGPLVSVSAERQGEPLTGFGERPGNKIQVLETSLCIVVPSLLLTWEQSIRCAQSFYVSSEGADMPWVSPLVAS